MSSAAQTLQCRCGAGLLALLGLLVGLPAAWGETTEERSARVFQERLGRDWQALLENSEQVAGSVEVIDSTQPDGAARTIYEFDYCDHNALVRCRRPTAAGTVEEVACRNAHYAFRLERAGQGPWQRTDFARGAVPEAVRRALEEAQHRWPQACVRFQQRTLLQWFQTPGFHITAVEPVEFEGVRGLTRVAFTAPASEGPAGATVTGYWILNGAAFWALHYGELHAADAAGTVTYRETVRFDPEVGSRWPLLREGQYAGRDAQGHPVSVRFTYKHFRYEGNTPEYRFTLAAFGLPEPGVGNTPLRAGPCALAFLAVAAVLLVVRGVRFLGYPGRL